MNEHRRSSLLHRFAILTACVALLPIVVGALVTTMNWGMAFLDWPTSDGHGMLSYDWFSSFPHRDKFAEHGHRLAGVLIGLTSIALVAVAFATEKRRWVKTLAAAILAAVIVQGLLGGLRVVRDADAAALVHGTFAAVVFTMMGLLILVTGRKWMEIERQASERTVKALKPLALATPVVILCQYVLGGMLRHLGTALYEHMGFAAVAAILVIATVVSVRRTRSPWLRRSANALLAILVLQISLGVGSYITKFGLASLGYVAVDRSLPQVLLRSSHTVVGVLLLMASTALAVQVWRWEYGKRTAVWNAGWEPDLPMPAKGGAA